MLNEKPVLKWSKKPPFTQNRPTSQQNFFQPFPRWQPLQSAPEVFHVYYVPEQKAIPDNSIIYRQKKQNGFFQHPILVVKLNGENAFFYALSSNRPAGIHDLLMYLRLGSSTADEGPMVLKISENSAQMRLVTYVNLEQRFEMEWRYIHNWQVPVCVDLTEFQKLDERVRCLEASQNRFLYDPLPTDFRKIEPGTVVMLLNLPGAPTRGAPVLVLENRYPQYRYLRIKLQAEHFYFRGKLQATGADLKGTKLKYYTPLYRCMKLGGEQEAFPDGSNPPALSFRVGSPAMRLPSFVEASEVAQWGSLNQCKTWCVPPVRLEEKSLERLERYLIDVPYMKANLASQRADTSAWARTGDRNAMGYCRAVGQVPIAAYQQQTLVTHQQHDQVALATYQYQQQIAFVTFQHQQQMAFHAYQHQQQMAIARFQQQQQTQFTTGYQSILHGASNTTQPSYNDSSSTDGQHTPQGWLNVYPHAENAPSLPISPPPYTDAGSPTHRDACSHAVSSQSHDNRPSPYRHEHRSYDRPSSSSPPSYR